jgi:hypothetical protein
MQRHKKHAVDAHIEGRHADAAVVDAEDGRVPRGSLGHAASSLLVLLYHERSAFANIIAFQNIQLFVA